MSTDLEKTPVMPTGFQLNGYQHILAPMAAPPGGRGNHCVKCCHQRKAQWFQCDNGDFWWVAQNGNIYCIPFGTMPGKDENYTAELKYYAPNYVPWRPHSEDMTESTQGVSKFHYGKPHYRDYIGFQVDERKCVVFWKGKIIYEGEYDGRGSLGRWSSYSCGYNWNENTSWATRLAYLFELDDKGKIIWVDKNDLRAGCKCPPCPEIKPNTCPVCDENLPAGETCASCGYEPDWQPKRKTKAKTFYETTHTRAEYGGSFVPCSASCGYKMNHEMEPDPTKWTEWTTCTRNPDSPEWTCQSETCSSECAVDACGTCRYCGTAASQPCNSWTWKCSKCNGINSRDLTVGGGASGALFPTNGTPQAMTDQCNKFNANSPELGDGGGQAVCSVITKFQETNCRWTPSEPMGFQIHPCGGTGTDLVSIIVRNNLWSTSKWYRFVGFVNNKDHIPGFFDGSEDVCESGYNKQADNGWIYTGEIPEREQGDDGENETCQSPYYPEEIEHWKRLFQPYGARDKGLRDFDVIAVASGFDYNKPIGKQAGGVNVVIDKDGNDIFPSPAEGEYYTERDIQQFKNDADWYWLRHGEWIKGNGKFVDLEEAQGAQLRTFLYRDCQTGQEKTDDTCPEGTTVDGEGRCVPDDSLTCPPGYDLDFDIVYDEETNEEIDVIPKCVKNDEWFARQTLCETRRPLIISTHNLLCCGNTALWAVNMMSEQAHRVVVGYKCEELLRVSRNDWGGETNATAWTCQKCGSSNAGTDATCTHEDEETGVVCGEPRPADWNRIGQMPEEWTCCGNYVFIRVSVSENSQRNLLFHVSYPTLENGEPDYENGEASLVFDSTTGYKDGWTACHCGETNLLYRSAGSEYFMLRSVSTWVINPINPCTGLTNGVTASKNMLFWRGRLLKLYDYTAGDIGGDGGCGVVGSASFATVMCIDWYRKSPTECLRTYDVWKHDELVVECGTCGGTGTDDGLMLLPGRHVFYKNCSSVHGCWYGHGAGEDHNGQWYGGFGHWENSDIYQCTVWWYTLGLHVATGLTVIASVEGNGMEFGCMRDYNICDPLDLEGKLDGLLGDPKACGRSGGFGGDGFYLLTPPEAHEFSLDESHYKRDAGCSTNGGDDTCKWYKGCDTKTQTVNVLFAPYSQWMPNNSWESEYVTFSLQLESRLGKEMLVIKNPSYENYECVGPDEQICYDLVEWDEEKQEYVVVGQSCYPECPMGWVTRWRCSGETGHSYYEVGLPVVTNTFGAAAGGGGWGWGNFNPGYHRIVGPNPGCQTYAKPADHYHYIHDVHYISFGTYNRSCDYYCEPSPAEPDGTGLSLDLGLKDWKTFRWERWRHAQPTPDHDGFFAKNIVEKDVGWSAGNLYEYCVFPNVAAVFTTVASRQVAPWQCCTDNTWSLWSMEVDCKAGSVTDWEAVKWTTHTEVGYGPENFCGKDDLGPPSGCEERPGCSNDKLIVRLSVYSLPQDYNPYDYEPFTDVPPPEPVKTLWWSVVDLISGESRREQFPYVEGTAYSASCCGRYWILNETTNGHTKHSVHFGIGSAFETAYSGQTQKTIFHCCGDYLWENLTENGQTTTLKLYFYGRAAAFPEVDTGETISVNCCDHYAVVAKGIYGIGFDRTVVGYQDGNDFNIDRTNSVTYLVDGTPCKVHAVETITVPGETPTTKERVTQWETDDEYKWVFPDFDREYVQETGNFDGWLQAYETIRRNTVDTRDAFLLDRGTLLVRDKRLSGIGCLNCGYLRTLAYAPFIEDYHVGMFADCVTHSVTTGGGLTPVRTTETTKCLHEWFPNVQRSDSIPPPNTMPENKDALWKWREAFPNMGAYVEMTGIVSKNYGADTDIQEKPAPHNQDPPPGWYETDTIPHGKYLYFNDRNAPTRFDMTILTGDPFELKFNTETVTFNANYPTVVLEHRAIFIVNAWTTTTDENTGEPIILWLVTTLHGDGVTFERETADGTEIPDGATVTIEYGYYEEQNLDPLAVGTYLEPWRDSCRSANYGLDSDVVTSPIDARVPEGTRVPEGIGQISGCRVVMGANGVLMLFDTQFGRYDFNAETGKLVGLL